MSRMNKARQAAQKPDESTRRVVVLNRKARHNYEIVETHEAGMALIGAEVKSIHLGKAQLQDSYCKIEKGELWVHEMYVAPYEKATTVSVDPRRTRKLLMHRREIERLDAKAQEKSYAIVPLTLYFRNGKAKVEIALARGRRQYDHREQIAKRETRREMEQSTGGRSE